MKDHPQLLEKLGIKVYSEGYVRAKPKTNGEQPPADGGTPPSTQSTQPAANAGVVENEGSPVEPAAVQTAPDNNKKKKRK
ncbi:MAG: hypothetical protein NT166_30195 [Candidatus Aminicenantes bacterium]|nr:hypothetical protein [Candidatus Aminicenantes bacterium]